MLVSLVQLALAPDVIASRVANEGGALANDCPYITTFELPVVGKRNVASDEGGIAMSMISGSG